MRPLRHKPTRTYVTPIWNGIVEFGQVASDEQKQLAWSLKTDCMIAPHGCSDISEIMPELWKRVSPDSVSSRVRDRKSTRLNSSHDQISYAVFCLKKKKHNTGRHHHCPLPGIAY